MAIESFEVKGVDKEAKKKQMNSEPTEKEKLSSQESVRDLVCDQFKAGRIVVSGFEGLVSMNLNDFLNQPADGILYDLNRLEEVIMTFIDDPKWVNDYAATKTIRALKERLDAVEKNGEKQ